MLLVGGWVGWLVFLSWFNMFLLFIWEFVIFLFFCFKKFVLLGLRRWMGMVFGSSVLLIWWLRWRGLLWCLMSWGFCIVSLRGGILLWWILIRCNFLRGMSFWSMLRRGWGILSWYGFWFRSWGWWLFCWVSFIWMRMLGLWRIIWGLWFVSLIMFWRMWRRDLGGWRSIWRSDGLCFWVVSVGRVVGWVMLVFFFFR